MEHDPRNGGFQIGPSGDARISFQQSPSVCGSGRIEVSQYTYVDAKSSFLGSGGMGNGAISAVSQGTRTA